MSASRAPPASRSHAAHVTWLPLVSQPGLPGALHRSVPPVPLLLPFARAVLAPGSLCPPARCLSWSPRCRPCVQRCARSEVCALSGTPREAAGLMAGKGEALGAQRSGVPGAAGARSSRCFARLCLPQPRLVLPTRPGAGGARRQLFCHGSAACTLILIKSGEPNCLFM